MGDLSTQSFIKAFSICPIPTCGSARDDGVGERPHRHFDRSKAEWRNLTPPWYRKHWGGRSLDSEFHRSGFPLTPIPAHPPARDDDIGGHPYRHFDRSGAEWRNLTPQWAKKELGFRRWLFRRAASHRENDSLHFVRRSAPSKCVRCASLSLRGQGGRPEPQ